MAAGQRKKKLNGGSVSRLNFYEHNVGRKKMKLESCDVFLNMTSHVSLEWDESQNKVVAKRGQVGITWRDMTPFLDCIPELRRGLADVLSVPRGIFGLENVADVLSYEVWETFLSEQERKLLVQFLPKGVKVDDVVRSLLAGENFHFGNPLCKWGVSLCAGDLHPDVLLHMERHLRVSRNSYLCELRKYHSGIVGNLSKLKERWTSCKDPEKEITVKIWREGITKSTHRRPSVAPEKAKVLSSSEKEQSHNTCFHYGDTAKYMSYIKISKKQHQLVKSIDHFGDGIHSKCLKHVLGDIEDFNIQPYEAFEEEERKRLHGHWLELANIDLPAALENRRECRLLRDKWRKSIRHELMEDELTTKDERENLRCSHIGKADDGDPEQDSPHDIQDEGNFQPILFNGHHHLERNPSSNAHLVLSPTISDQEQNLDNFQATAINTINYSTDNCHAEKIPSLNSPQGHSPSSMDLGRNGYIVKQATTSPGPFKFYGHENGADDITESKALSTNVHHLERVPSLNSHITLSAVDVHEDGNQHLVKCSHNSPVIPQFLPVTPAADVTEEKLPLSPPKDIWRGGSTGRSYYRYSPESQVRTSAGELAVRQSQPMKERSSQLIDLGAQMLDQEATESIASPLHDNNRAAMFSSNASLGHNLLLPPFHMQGISSSYSEEHLDGPKQSEFQFLVANDGLRQSSEFPHLFHEQQQLLKQSQARERELYVQPMSDRNTHSSSRYPSQGHFLSVGLHDLTNFQCPVNGGLVGHNWFTGEHDTHNGWPGAETFGTASQRLEDAGGADGSLFSVLSGCSKLPSHSSFVTASSQGFLPSGNFVGASNPRGDGTYPYAPALTDASSRDAAALKMNSTPWMNFYLENRRL